MANAQTPQDQKRPNIWELGPFTALLADPFVEDNGQATVSSLTTSCAVLEMILHESQRMQAWKDSPLLPHLVFLRKLSATEAPDVSKFKDFITLFMTQLKELPKGEIMFIPGGWLGSTTLAELVFIAEHKQSGAFDLVICNAGMGLNYHPSRIMEEDPTKVKYQTCWRLEDIPAERFLDTAFWETFHLQWMKPSEFHRVEVLYDVLFPWLYGEPTLSGALDKAASDETAEWRTMQRAGSSSAWRSLMEAVRYFLRKYYGADIGELKRFKTLLKCEALVLALSDMEDENRDPPTKDHRTLIELGCQTAAHAVLKLGGGAESREREKVRDLINTIKAKLEEADAQDQDKEDEVLGLTKADPLFPEPFSAEGLVQTDAIFSGARISDEDCERYTGPAQEPRASMLSDLLKVPFSKASNVAEAVTALVRCDQVCHELNERCRDGSSFSSRVALQFQISELIRAVITEVVPIPSQSGPGKMWGTFPTEQLLSTCLRVVHKLTLAYASAWQSFDSPTRAFDSERSVVALCLLAIFDSVLRQNPFGSVVSTVINDDGGYSLSTSVCVANISLYKLSSTMEIHSPNLALARSACLAYFDTIQKNTRYHDLFTLRMPTDKVEMKKYGTSVLFLRKIMEHCGYELFPRDTPDPPPEIEALMEWMTAPGTPLASEHPEFGLLRDMACLYKFLATMESRESELQRQRIAPSEYVSWSLSFEDTSMDANTFRGHRAAFSNGLRWEVLNYRGLDLDTADVQVTIFGDRKIYFGEGLVVHSPADPNMLLGNNTLKRPTEDDILHSDMLPNFGDTLSRQESEILSSYLTVPYLRIPLVLAFFATGDRVTYLFNHGLQALLRAVLFDASDWVPKNDKEKVVTVPVNSQGAQSSLEEAIGTASANAKGTKVLGTSDGLLLNELQHSPEATLRPLMRMLLSINDLAEASVYSPDAALSLYLIEIALDVQSYIQSNVNLPVEQSRRDELRDYLHRTCRNILRKWLQEALTENDIETSCMIHSYLALIWSNIPADEVTVENFSELLGSLCFVRNWHGFGLSETNALLGYGSSVESTDAPEQRLLRFMQAHGVDTTRVAQGSLQKYLGNSRPLYLRVGAKTFRVPKLRDDDTQEDKKRLLAIVPEQKLFAMLQRQRSNLVAFMESLDAASSAVATSMLTKVVRIALDTKGSTLDPKNEEIASSDQGGVWTKEFRGKYVSPDKELTIDIQGGQIMWRNDELKPLPDTMTHFNDFHTIFGKQQLHCGVVATQQHRNWVHVVGTPYDLLLWDEPDDNDQGVEAPKDVSASTVPTDSSNGAATEARWQCTSCTFMNSHVAQKCQMCDSPKPAPQAAQQAPRPPGQGPSPGGEEEVDLQQKSPSAIKYRDVLYDRSIDPFDKESMKKLDDEGEKWALELIVPALLGHYKEKLAFKLLLPHDHIKEDDDIAYCMAGVKTQHEIEKQTVGRSMFRQRPIMEKVLRTTWKEFVLYRHRGVLHVYNLRSHGRKMFRQLVYTSSSKIALHGLQPSSSVLGASGDLKAILMPEPSLVITRSLGGNVETFVPGRLLFGVLPSALLEAYQFWYGSDGVLRGEPLDPDSTWFGSKEIVVGQDRVIHARPFSKRRSLGVVHSVLAGTASAERRRLVVQNSDEAAATHAKNSKASGSAEEIEFDEESILELCSLGFSPAAARLALSKNSGNPDIAAGWLLNPDNQGQVDAAEDSENIVFEPGTYRVVSHSVVVIRSKPSTEGSFLPGSNVLAFGQEIEVVERSGDWVRLADKRGVRQEQWVLTSHPIDGTLLERVPDHELNEAQVDDKATSAATKAAELHLKELEKAKAHSKLDGESTDSENNGDVQGSMKLVNLLEKPVKGQSIYQLVTILTEIEDLSHVLAWADRDDNEIQIIELPRLKLRIEPRENRLVLTDQAGWFICNKTRRFRKLLNAHSLLIMDGQRQVQFLVPNHQASRPVLKGKPFSCEILCDRGSFSWLQTMDTRYYLYRVHTSGTFLVSQELSASLYLVHLKLLKRQYSEAFTLAPTCTVDVPFTPDEGFIWGQLEKSMDDRHPDAHAVRLRLSLATMYAADHIHSPWEVHAEMHGYLSKLPRVSANCRLTQDEELKVCKLSSSGTVLIKMRLATLLAKPLHPIELKGPTPRVGGAPWNKVQSQTLTYYDHHGLTLKRMHFKPQVGSGGFDGFMADVIFSEQIITDEESGVNRQLGFAFLYQLITSDPVPGAENIPKSVGELHARYLHLKLSRWGRESVASGEIEASNSRHMAQLAALLAEPTRPWPKLPVDGDSLNQLRNGINLYSQAGRESSVKMWLDFVDLEFKQAWPGIVERNDPTCRLREGFVLKDQPNAISFPIQPISIADTGCSRRTMLTDSVRRVMAVPLGDLQSEYLKSEKLKNSENPPASKLPFDLSKHPAAQPTVAREILERLEEDVKGYAKAQSTGMVSVLKSTKPEALKSLLVQLEAIQQKDAESIRQSIQALEFTANRLSEDPNEGLVLKAIAKLRDRITFSLLTQALLSKSAIDDLHNANPSLSKDDIEAMLDEVTSVLVFTNRISHANRASALVRQLLSLTEDMKKDKSKRLAFRGKQLASSLAEVLATERHYLEKDGGFDPRFLVFEYVFDIILRDRQVEIVRSFAEDVKVGRSHVQQMIMGAGKTTVVAPLLTLLLADGETLVTQVMPTALLEQTRHIMRSRFAAVITKRVFTLEFDRSCADAVDVANAVFNKLDEARRSRSVVCASPDAVKSLFLKFVEHLHSLESVDPEVLQPSKSLRQNKEIIQLRDTVQARSDMSDSLVPILDMWRDGVLIMDEVDVLLHPLRSELNFPIGLKDPIDLSGFRWDLPIHLLRAFFPETLLEEKDQASIKILEEISEAVEEGYRKRALQRNPHLVLLDENFYRTQLMELAAKWCSVWILQNSHDLPPQTELIKYLVADEVDSTTPEGVPFKDCSGTNIKLVNLGRDWIRVLLPHVLSKIDRVSFGLLSSIDLANIDHATTPASRKLMAVPFVGKDVPSRSSEFAHPDVVIGLSVLGYRYEGLRLSDVRTLVGQLKADFSRQVGPRDKRPASLLFREWLDHASRDNEDEQLPVLPLPLFQVNDPKQLQRLYGLLRREEPVITYYLRQHVFPACMNFQSIKISACGHELGSSMLFRKRIGFSGTPSNLLPNDLGQCMYEPGSDGKIVHVLSSKQVVSVERKENWTAKSLLRDVAAGSPDGGVYHALIDTGALITGMDNEQVARYLLDCLPASHFDGVVYLDRSDRKMFLQRSSGKSLHLSQCGVATRRRFTFYDQVHTTGMDISQAPDACAVVTIGKDMTFRDYAQGTFRMRGIGAGQTIHLYLIPEVEQLIHNELGGKRSRDKPFKAVDVPAWLLINSMRTEAVQYSMLSLQELYNCWRKEGMRCLVEDVRKYSPFFPDAPLADSPIGRLRRFVDGDDDGALRRSVQLFREHVGFEVPDHIPSPQPFYDKVHDLIAENKHFITSDAAQRLVEDVAERVKYTKDLATEELEAEVVNENEQEQQQQQEEEAEEEQEKVSRYTRDDEQANPWQISLLNSEPTCVAGEAPFYRFSAFSVRRSQPKLEFPPYLLCSDNWFRPRWIGLGDRRLKNVLVIMEWYPKSFGTRLQRLVPMLHQYVITNEGLSPNAAALRALSIATAPTTAEDSALRKRMVKGLTSSNAQNLPDADRFFVAVSLAEAETLRRALHTSQVASLSDFRLLSIEDGSSIDETDGAPRIDDKAKFLSLACLRLLNGDMHYTDLEIDALQEAFRVSPISDRITFFEDCLRLRRREKYLWGDTPLAKFFTEKEEWHLLEARARLQQMSMSLIRLLKSPQNRIDLLSLFTRSDTDNDGALFYAEMQRFLEELRLGYSPADVASVVRLIDQDHSQKISWERFVQAFMLPETLLTVEEDAPKDEESTRWICSNCTFAFNDSRDTYCQVCSYGWDGQLHVPSDKWMCDPSLGGCTFFNPEGAFFCEICNRSKPALQNVRF